MGGGTSLSSHRAGFGVFWSKGFTLAEVLITLAIIGIVAALTIPTLIQNYQEKAWNTASTVFERKLEESLKVMNAEGTLAGYSSTEAFVDELKNHMKIDKICKNDDLTACFEDNISFEVLDIELKKKDIDVIDIDSMQSASNFGHSDWNTETIGLQFANGVSAILVYNPDCYQDPYSNQVTGTSCLAIIYDTSGFKSPNSFPNDVRGINSFLNNCLFKIGNSCFSEPFMSEAITSAECEKIADLGYGNKKTSCRYYEKDYWAGAVKACGGTQYMPTMAHLAKIGDYVYNTSGIGAEQNIFDGLKLDSDKLAGLGLKLVHLMGSYHVWSGDEGRSWNSSKMRVFGSDNFLWSGGGRDSTGSWTMTTCLMNY